jgi:hypothetical protein
MRHLIGKKALREWGVRQKGRDKKRRMEQLVSDKNLLRPVVQDMIEKGEIKI